MEKTWIIYLLICIPLEKGYVGQTTLTVEQRCKHGKGYKTGTPIREAFDKYTEDDFVCIILEEDITSQEKADEREKYWIETLGTIDPWGFNRQNGGHFGQGSHEVTNQKISQKHIGLKLSNETKKKIAATLHNNLNSPSTSKKVKQYTLDGQFLKEFPSLHEAERQTGISHQCIYHACRGISKTAGNSIWKYA